jgi:hypothetical protein
MVAIQANLDSGRDGDRGTGRRKEAEAEGGNAGGEHMMHPEAEAEEAGSNERNDDQLVSDE